MKKIIITLLLFALSFAAFAQKNLPGIDATKFYCLTPNSTITIRIYYEFQLIDDSKYEQKFIEAECYIDDEGYISLPPFFESIRTGSGTLRLNLLNYQWCGGKNNCVTYAAAEEAIKKNYDKKIGTNDRVKEISVSIMPPKYFTNITVYYKGGKFVLPYSENTLERLISNSIVRKEIGLRKQNLKATIISRCNIESSEKYRTIEYCSDCCHMSVTRLYPGDIIYIK